MTLATNPYQLRATLRNQKAILSWQGATDQEASVLIQRSMDGVNFSPLSVAVIPNEAGNFSAQDDIRDVKAPVVYYRLLIRDASGKVQYSNVVRLQNDQHADGVVVFPNPATNKVQLLLPAKKYSEAYIKVFDRAGATVYTDKVSLGAAPQVYSFKGAERWQKGMYLVSVQMDGTNYTHKLIMAN
jgi:hypothetical protein